MQRRATHWLARKYTTQSYDKVPSGVFKHPNAAELIASAKSPERIPTLHGLPEVCSSATPLPPKTLIRYWTTPGHRHRARELREIKLVQRGFGTSRVVADKQESCACSGLFFFSLKLTCVLCRVERAHSIFFESGQNQENSCLSIRPGMAPWGGRSGDSYLTSIWKRDKSTSTASRLPQPELPRMLILSTYRLKQVYIVFNGKHPLNSYDTNMLAHLSQIIISQRERFTLQAVITKLDDVDPKKVDDNVGQIRMDIEKVTQFCLPPILTSVYMNPTFGVEELRRNIEKACGLATRKLAQLGQVHGPGGP